MSKAGSPSPKIRPVVSSFISTGHVGTSTFRVALFKRSRENHVYPGRWAACFGSLRDSDKTPLQGAIREIREETGLELSSADCMRHGMPLELVDEEIGTRWQIWPFVFSPLSFKSGEDMMQAIVLNEEHSEVQLFSMEELDEIDTVDGLPNTLRRVCADASVERAAEP